MGITAWHVYRNYTSSHTLMMDAGGVAGIVPIVATEISDRDQRPRSLSPPRDDTPVLISNYDGTAACSGTTYKAHLLATAH